jgi:Flp pilus assembly protein TadD
MASLGEALYRAGRPREAIAPLTEAVRLQPGDPLLRNTLGGALRDAGRIGEAIAQFSEALRIQPDNAVVRQHLQAAQAIEEASEKK